MSENYTSKEVVIQGEYKISGTLTMPSRSEDKVPAVVLLHGSGNVDRDENAPKLPLNVFKELSEHICSLGFATLRYDKRGCGKSGGVYEEAGFWDLVRDAESAVEFLKKQDNIDPDNIILIGHSEGCAIAPAVNERIPVQGIVLLAGFRGSVFDSTDYQLDNVLKEIENTKGIKGFLFKIINVPDKLRKQNKKSNELIMNSTEPVIRVKGKKVNAKWFREHKEYNVDESLKKVQCPLLAIVGSKDLQVIPEQTKLIGEIVQGPFEYRIIQDVNHILRRQSEPTSMLKLIKIYKSELSMPIDSEVIDTLKVWLKKFLE